LPKEEKKEEEKVEEKKVEEVKKEEPKPEIKAKEEPKKQASGIVIAQKKQKGKVSSSFSPQDPNIHLWTRLARKGSSKATKRSTILVTNKRKLKLDNQELITIPLHFIKIIII